MQPNKISAPPSVRVREVGSAYLEQLCLVVSRVHCIVVLARTTQQLPPIHRYGRQAQTPVRIHDPTPVLPLHDPARTCWVLGVGDGAVVGFLVVAVAGEGVGDARAGGLDEALVERIVETLARISVLV